jgi:hypothetical protein
MAVLAALALALPTTASALFGTRSAPADEATITADGCRVTKNRDHSVTVRCPAGRWATLEWVFLGTGTQIATITCLEGPCIRKPSVTGLGRSGIKNLDGYRVIQRVQHNRVASAAVADG